MLIYGLVLVVSKAHPTADQKKRQKRNKLLHHEYCYSVHRSRRDLCHVNLDTLGVLKAIAYIRTCSNLSMPTARHKCGAHKTVYKHMF